MHQKNKHYALQFQIHANKSRHFRLHFYFHHLDAEFTGFLAVAVHVASGGFAPAVVFSVDAPIPLINTFSLAMAARLGANLSQQSVAPFRLLLGKVGAVILLIDASWSISGVSDGNQSHSQKKRDSHSEHFQI